MTQHYFSDFIVATFDGVESYNQAFDGRGWTDTVNETYEAASQITLITEDVENNGQQLVG